ncbi:hypothetical protein BH09ACT13_BH09ACT13_00850 [soil metagenome]
MRRLAILAVAVLVQVMPASASTEQWVFKTPGNATYCTMSGAFLCMRPSDGFWLRFTGVFGDTDVRKGYSNDFRGFRGSAQRVLRVGEVFYTSDAAVITCWSRRAGVTCKHYEGLSFWLGRQRGYRIFWDSPGFPPDVHPLFRTAHGIRCGIDRDNLEPAAPILECWRSADGLVLGVAHADEGRRGGHGRREQAIGFTPGGFRLLANGRTFVWRCRDASAMFADACSTRAGEPVFTCTSTRARLTCQNRNGRGFWANARTFYTF